MNNLNQPLIQQSLLQGKAFVFEQIDSTNEYLLNHCKTVEIGSVCLAETQTAGRGRRGRQWYSSISQNLYLSLLWRYPIAQSEQISSLSLVIALIIAETLQSLKVEHIHIKWPNDIYYRGKKMGGILLESRLDDTGIYVVIGIGLNLAMAKVDDQIVTQAWSDLSDYSLDRNQLIARLVRILQRTLMEFPQKSFSAYLQRWQNFDLFYQKNVKLVTDTAEIYGVSQGVNAQGELILQQDDSQTCFAIGELSLRADN